MRFHDRFEAGQALAAKLMAYRDDPHVIVVGLPRGGVPVAFEVAQSLGAPLDVFLVRKVGFPGQEELAMGAVASGGVQVLNEEVLRQTDLSMEEFEQVARVERQELQRRENMYRQGRPPLSIRGKTVIVVDDGLATGSSMRAAARALGQLQPARIVAAVPVGAAETCASLSQEVDEVVCLESPDEFMAVGYWYEDFSPTTDEQVRLLLREADFLREAAAVDELSLQTSR